MVWSLALLIPRPTRSCGIRREHSTPYTEIEVTFIPGNNADVAMRLLTRDELEVAVREQGESQS